MRADKIERISRLTPMQDGMLFEALRKDDPSETVYQYVLSLTGWLEADLLTQAWRRVAARHPILRAALHHEHTDLPVQVVQRDVDISVELLDWRDRSADARLAGLESLLEQEKRSGFPITRPPLWRVRVIREATEEWRLIWSFHHVLLDGWSLQLVLADVFETYAALCRGEEPHLPPARPFWEFVAWTQRQELASAEKFWRDRVRGIVAPTPLGPAGSGSGLSGQGFGEYECDLDPRLHEQLRAAARRSGVTVGSLVHGVWGLLMADLSGDRDVVFGAVVSGRPPSLPGVSEMAGLFINVLPVRVEVDRAQPVADWLGRLQRDLVAAREYEYTPLGQIQRWSDVPPGVPMFESLVAFLNYPHRPGWDTAGEIQVNEMKVRQEPHYPLHLTVRDADPLHLHLGFDAARFTAAQAEVLVTHVVTILEHVVCRPEGVLADLPALPALPPGPTAERTPATPEDVVALIRHHAAARPDAAAVTDGNGSLSYARLAALLAGAGGAEPVPPRVAALVDAIRGDGAVLTLPHGLVAPRSAVTALLCAAGAAIDLTAGDRICCVDAGYLGDPDLDLLWVFVHGATALLDGAATGGAPTVTTAVRVEGTPRVIFAGATLPGTQLRGWSAGGAEVVQVLNDGAAVIGGSWWLSTRRRLWDAPVRLSRPRAHARVLTSGVTPASAAWAVESRLSALPRIDDVVALAGPDGGTVVLTGDPGTEPQARAALTGMLPEEFLPQHFRWVADIGRGERGRPDTGQLATGDPAVPARRWTPTQEILAGVWSEVLETAQPGLEDDFFATGGHSLIAIRLVSRVRAVFGVRLTLTTLFNNPTLAGLADAVDGALAASAPAPSETPVPKAAGAPVLSYGQEQMWALDQIGEGAAYVIPLTGRIVGRLDVAALRAALAEVVGRHEVLRTAIRTEEGRPVIVVHDRVEAALREHDLAHLPPAEAARAAESLILEQARTPFDLGQAPLARFQLIRLAPEEHVLASIFHHVVIDAWSTAVFVADLRAAYEAVVAGTAPMTPKPPVGFAAYAAWQRDHVERNLDTLLEYWRRQLEGAPVTSTLPADRSDPSPSAGRHEFDIPAGTVVLLHEFARARHATLYMVLLAAFSAVLGRYSGERDLVVATPVAGRNRPEFEKLMGFFVNTLPLRVDLSDDPSFATLVERVRQTCLGALANQDLPFERLVAHLRPGRVAGGTPYTQAMFNLQNAPVEEFRLGGARMEPFPIDFAVARQHLNLELIESDGVLRVTIQYRADRYSAGLVARFARDFTDLLRRCVDAPESRVLNEVEMPVDATATLRAASRARLGRSMT